MTDCWQQIDTPVIIITFVFGYIIGWGFANLDKLDEEKRDDCRTCENCKYFYTDKNKDTHCSEIGWHMSMYDYEDEDKEHHGRIYISKDFGCNKWEAKDD